MTHNDSKTSESDEKPSSIKEAGILIYKNVYIRLATLGTVIALLVSGTASYMQMQFVQPEKEKLASRVTEIGELTRDKQKLQSTIDQLSKEVDVLNQSEKIPTLIFPVDNRPIIGRYVRFKWSYDVTSGYKNFIIELRRVSPEGNIVSRYPIPEGHKRREIQFQFPAPLTGQFYWRIGTGELLRQYQDYGKQISSSHGAQGKMLGKNNQRSGLEKETRLWSRFGSFSMYKSMWEKLKRTQTLVVGTTAAYLSYDYPVDSGGRPISYDMDLIDHVARELEKKLRNEVLVEHDVKFWLRARKLSNDYLEKEEMKHDEAKKKLKETFRLNVVTKIIDWSDKFSSVIQGDVDLVIANITISDTREEDNPGLRFSTGYRENKQTLIASKLHPPLENMNLEEQDLIENLDGKSLAVQATSTNKTAAEYLKEEKGFNYKIDTKDYDSYVDVIDQVRSGKSNFGLIDSVRFDSVRYPDLIKVDINLDKYLISLYNDSFGTPTEQYGIAVASYGGENLFLDYLNRIIDSRQELRDCLEKKHNVNEDIPSECDKILSGS